MSRPPFFSVIIPVYNRRGMISRAIESVIAQSFSDYELIVIDDGSTDGTGEVMRDYNCQIITQQNQGVAAARNAGIMSSRGKWICFLDSDDEWMLSKLEKQFQMIENNPDAVLIHSNENWIRDGKIISQKKHRKGGGDQFLPSVKECVIGPSCTAVKREILIENGCFDESYPVCEDYDLWLKITSMHPVHFIEEALVNKYGGHDDQLSFKFFAMDYWRIKSIDRVLRTKEINKVDHDPAVQTLLKKSARLLMGYIKHDNFKNYDEILAIEKFWS